jgi:O-antigen/teichoic acid export membrane protein
MSLRTLARASGLYTLGSIAPKIGAFILLPVYVRFLSRAEYGTVALMTTVSGLLALILTLGLDGALMRMHFDREGRQRAALYTTLTLFSLAVSLIWVLAVGVVVGPFFPSLFAGVPFFPIGALTLIIAFTSVIQYVPTVLLRATGRAGYYVAYNLGTFVIASVASVLLVVVVRLGAAAVLLGQLTGAAVVFAVAVFLVFQRGEFAFDGRALGAALRFGLPLVPHSLSAWALRLSDRWLIGLLIGLPALQAQAAIGVYSFGYQIGYVISLIVISFNAAWSPYFYRIADQPPAPSLLRHVTTLVVAGLFALAVAVSALAPEIVAVIATERYAQAADVIPIVAFASVLQGLYTMLVTVIFFMRRTGRLAVLTVSAAMLNVALNVVLIPRLGIVGAAWSTLIAFVPWAAATWWYASRMYPVRLDYSRLGLLAGVAVLAVGVARLTVLPANPVAQGALHVVIGLAYAAFAAFVGIGLLDRLRGLTRTPLPQGEQA